MYEGQNFEANNHLTFLNDGKKRLMTQTANASDETREIVTYRNYPKLHTILR